MKRVISAILLAWSLCTSAWAASMPGITLDVHGADIHDVVALLAMQSGTNIITDASIGKFPVTLRLENVSFERALSVLAHAYDLQVRHDGNILMLGASSAMNKKYGDDRDALASHTEILDLENAQPSEVAKALKEAIPPDTVLVADQRGGRLIVTGNASALARVRKLVRAIDAPRSDRAGAHGAVAIRLRYARAQEAAKQLHGVIPESTYVADDAQNAIILTGGGDTVSTARSFLRAIDVERQQVSFEVRVVDISLTKNSNVGVLFGSPSVGVGSAVTSFANSSVAINATLNGLIEDGRAKTLARPHVVTQNNSEASLLVGESYPIVTLTSNGSTSNQDVQYVDIGVKLKITPTIGGDGTIVADLNPEYSELLSVTSNGYPVIGTRKLNATVRVKNNQTIVLGGLLQDTDSETVTKVPLLGSVPVFGEIFRNRIHHHVRDEIVFLITPHVLQ
jgi:type II secretory pathway component GspD/PulD (secretin)